MPLMAVVPSAIAIGQRPERCPEVQQHAALPAQGGGQPGLSGGLTEQDCAGVADKSLSVRGDL